MSSSWNIEGVFLYLSQLLIEWFLCLIDQFLIELHSRLLGWMLIQVSLISHPLSPAVPLEPEFS